MASKRYVVRFEGNSSKHWDSKEIWLDCSILDKLYDTTKLFDGASLTVLFKGKGGKITHWNAKFVDPKVDASVVPAEQATSTTGNQILAANHQLQLVMSHQLQMLLHLDRSQARLQPRPRVAGFNVTKNVNNKFITESTGVDRRRKGNSNPPNSKKQKGILGHYTLLQKFQ